MTKVKCDNDQCENHGKVLAAAADTCPLCGKPTEKYVPAVKSDMGIGAAIASIASILIFWGVNWWFGIAASIVCIVIGIISKSKPAIVITLVSFVIIAALFVNFIILG